MRDSLVLNTQRQQVSTDRRSSSTNPCSNAHETQHRLQGCPDCSPQQQDMPGRGWGTGQGCVTFQVHARLQTLAVAARRAVLPADLVDDAVVPASTQVIVLPWAQTNTNTHKHQLPSTALAPSAISSAALRTTENLYSLHCVSCTIISI